MPGNDLRHLLVALFATASGVVHAGAFQLLEQNASGLGTAYAGSAAVADNASTLFYNPAGMTRLEGNQLSLGVTGIASRFEFRDQGSTVFGGNSGNGGNAGGLSAIPNAYLTTPIGERWAIGLGVYSPFGLSSEYSPNWVGSWRAVKSEIKTLNISPSLAYRVSDKVSLGMGLNYQKIEGVLSSSFGRMQGDDASWGWNAGALFTLSPSMRVGIAYRSPIKHRLDGSLNNSLAVQADVKLPDTLTLSVWQQLSERWEAMGDLMFTRWNKLRPLTVVDRSSGAELSSESFNYDNAWRLGWGAAYKTTEQTRLKFGLAYDRSPVNDGNRTPRVPDNDSYWFSLGAQWLGGAYGTVDIGYSYIYFRDTRMDRTESGLTLRGRYDADAHLFGVQYSLGF